MRPYTYLLLISLGAMVAGGRTWTDIRGRTVEAELVSVSLEQKTVTLKPASGKQKTLSFSKLSEVDREYLERYARSLIPPPVVLDLSEIPERKPWGREGEAVINAWYPRIAAMLYSDEYTPPKEIHLKINNPGKGVAAAAGNRIFVAASWIEKEPGYGFVVHELVHVVQDYRGGGVGWLTEGIADYIRWGLYEEKPLGWFHLPPNPEKDYRQSYQVSAGFLYWLENERSPGIVKKLNAAMRERYYSDDLFEKETGTALDALWAEYRTVREKMR